MEFLDNFSLEIELCVLKIVMNGFSNLQTVFCNGLPSYFLNIFRIVQV